MTTLTQIKAIGLIGGDKVILDGERDRVATVPSVRIRADRDVVRFRTVFGRVVEMPVDQLVTVEQRVLA